MSEVHSFQAEVSQLLDLVVHSLYSHKEVFVRELVSNASDALDKLRFRAITEPELLAGNAALEIHVVPDPEAGTLTIEDTGIGMTRDELAKNLGTIAHSGAREFLEHAAKAGKKDVQLIGQFGVGFYSAFLVADEVEVRSRAAGSGEAWSWRSDAKGTFTLAPATREARGTAVVLHLKDEHKEFLQPGRLRELVTRYSDYVNQPIKLGDAKKDPSTYETINRATALWQRPKGEITEEQAHELYRHLCHDYEDPAGYAHFKVEGTQEFAGILFVPRARPFDLRQPHERGLRLYVKRVLVMERCEELLPPWLRFVEGVIDSDDLPLNVSREMLQDSAVVRAIKKQVVRRVLDLLTDMAKDRAEDYLAFWRSFGAVLKEGLALDRDHKERLLPLLRYGSTRGDELTSLADYVARMKEGQKAVYYALGESAKIVASSPHLEALTSRGYEVLFMTDPVDEWVVAELDKVEDKRLVSAADTKLDLEEGDDEKKAREKESAELAPLVVRLKELLGDRVGEVRASERLVDSPACLVRPKGALSPLMERVLEERGQKVPHTKRILELNAKHPVVAALRALHERDAKDARLAEWVELLHDQAVLAEGGRVEDPGAFAKRITSLMVELSRAQRG